jgi:hypothetical protein
MMVWLIWSAVTPGSFRPISLQGCPVKIVGKMLTTRLQRQVSTLVDIDQTGFIKGRSISENFVYETELVQCCHKRKAATIVLKLDFAKAFDSVCWDSLLAILRARGFPDKWCDWIHQLQDTAKSTVLLNGVPGRWISCRKGLRQGEPLSPYLFILVADVLQRLLAGDAAIRHPLAPNHPCAVLQYADDTLIVVGANSGAVQRIRVCSAAYPGRLVSPSTTPRAPLCQCMFQNRKWSIMSTSLAAQGGASRRLT